MREVQADGELARVLALPTRTQGSADLIDALSAHLRKPHVCSSDCAGGVVRLLPLQTAILVEAHDHHGVFACAPIGSGKTLASVLAPTLFNAKRPLLVIPGGLREKTVADLKQYRQHWDIRNIEIVSYEFLAREEHANYLEEWQPDIIIFDEAQRAKDKKRSIARRVKRFVQAHPDVPIVVMSGTPAKRSIKDFAHTMHWALRDGTPLPLVQSTLSDWAAVVDAGVPGDQRLEAGALTVFGGNTQAIRQGMRRRIFSTPGALTSTESNVDAKLEITLRNVPLSPAEDASYKGLYEEMVTPDGHTFTDAVELWRYARQFGRGFFGRWDPRGPKDWLEARKEWHAGVRKVLSKSRKLDTARQVASQVEADEDHPLRDTYERWVAIEPSFIPNPVPVWVGSTALDYATSWARDGGIVWCEHKPFARRLADITGLRYFSEGGLTEDGSRSIVTCRDKAIIASIQACGTGYNLQHYDRALVTSCTPTATTWDQMLGRLHRQGQKSAIVKVDVMICCREDLAGFERAANEDAAFHRDLLAIPGKLLGQSKYSDRITQHGYAWGRLRRA